jgi:hypothetical protein
MTLRGQEVTEKYLAEHIQQNPQNIWELFPRDKALVEEVDQKIQSGELLATEAEELVRTNTEQAQREWILQTSRDLIKFIVEFETGQNLDKLLEKIRRGDKEAALALAGTIEPEPETPASEALMEIRRLYKDDAIFLSEMDQALKEARKKEQPEARRQGGEEILSTGWLIAIFFWIKFNKEWLRDELGSQEAAYEALVDHFGEDKELPSPESFGRMLQFFGF